MRIDTYERLEALRARYGLREFGKLCQKLLAISFRHAGFPNIVERGVQGVDIDVSGGSGRFAIEVKTTEGEEVSYERKDADGLAIRRRDGYQPVVAVLQARLFAGWLLARVDKLEPGQLLVDALRAYRLKELEDRINPQFEMIVEEHFKGVLQGGQTYLDEVLCGKGIGTIAQGR